MQIMMACSIIFMICLLNRRSSEAEQLAVAGSADGSANGRRATSTAGAADGDTGRAF